MLVAGPSPSEDFHQAGLQGGSQRKEKRGCRWDIQTIQRNHEETLEGGNPICFTACDSYLVLQGPWEVGKLVTHR